MQRPASAGLIRRALSARRLEGYRIAATETELDLLARYAWNLAMAEALYPPLHAVEVALRNSLHDAISSVHGPRWYAGNSVLVGQYVRDEVQSAVAGVPNPNAADAPDRVVAELNFGFWTTLLSRPYGRPPSRQRVQRPLGPMLLPVAFPSFPGQVGTLTGRAAIAKRFEDIRRLRNRIFHHEPIWRGRPDQLVGRVVTVDEQHGELLEALAWISTPLRDAIVLMDRFPSLHHAGVRPFRDMLARLP